MGIDGVGARGLRAGGALGSAGVDGVAELLGGLEEGDALGWDIDSLASLGVAADAGVALACAEAAKAADFDLVAGFEGSDDRLEEGIHDDLAIAAGKVAKSGHSIDKVGFGHRVVSLRHGRLSS